MSQKSKVPSIKFQIIIDSRNIFLSTTPEGKIRANITEVEANQLSRIVDAIIDAGPEAVDYFKKMVDEKIKAD
ncbi:MAG: hypothetical protein JJU13_20590 [Balneolaceae bacterium]|nr:hypothetical protein [Balneolaceae bacterium]